MSARRFWVETLGCPKNSVDSDKISGSLLAEGLSVAPDPAAADVIVVNTCAFVEDARRESVDQILALAGARRNDAEIVVTGCLAERYGAELADALPEVDRVVGFGEPVLADQTPWVPVSIGSSPVGADESRRPVMDLLDMPRPAPSAPWAYVKVAEGCDRRCGFCAIPSFRGAQRSRTTGSVLNEIEALAGQGVAEVVLVAQDLASFGRDQGRGNRRLVPLVEAAAGIVDRVRLLYLYPSELRDDLIEAICSTGVPYFDLSLQHVSRPLVRRMRRWGSGAEYLERIEMIRAHEPEAAFRSNFIVGYPGETEEDHDALLDFLAEGQLDWCGLFAYSPEEGTHAADLDGAVPSGLVTERLNELRNLQDDITAARRDWLVGSTVSVLVDEIGRGRTYREAPEIDGIVHVAPTIEVGSIVDVEVASAQGTDLLAVGADT